MASATKGSVFAASLTFAAGACYAAYTTLQAHKSIQKHKLDFAKFPAAADEALSGYNVRVKAPYGVVNNGAYTEYPGNTLAYFENRTARIITDEKDAIVPVMRFIGTCMSVSRFVGQEEQCFKFLKWSRDQWESYERQNHDLGHVSRLREPPKPAKKIQGDFETLSRAFALALASDMSAPELYREGPKMAGLRLEDNGAIALRYAPNTILTSYGEFCVSNHPGKHGDIANILGKVKMRRLPELSLTYSIVKDMEGTERARAIVGVFGKPKPLEWDLERDAILVRVNEILKQHLRKPGDKV